MGKVIDTKNILGLVEEVKIYLPNGKFIRRKAKIDTGARSTAIDVRVAEKIGMGNVYHQFHKLMPKLRVTKDNFKLMRYLVKTEIAPDLRRKIPGLKYIRIIPATNGITVRPYVNFEYKLKNRRITTVVNIVDRKFLLYPVLIGKNDMGGFLIDPTKNPYRDA